MLARAFLCNNLCDGPLSPRSLSRSQSPAQSPVAYNFNERKLSLGEAAVVSLVVLSVLLPLLCFFRRKKKQSSVAPAAPPIVDSGAGRIDKQLIFVRRITPRVYDLEDLLDSPAELLGRGMNGTTYKVTMEAGIAVAVKRLKDALSSAEELGRRVKALAAVEHPNLVPLHAYYHSKGEKFLVYEYVPGRSLFNLLHGNRGGDGGRTCLDWAARVGITLAAGGAIENIHSRAASHGSIKSSNILLSSAGAVGVSDAGLHCLRSHATPSRSAPSGYRAPEVNDCRKISCKADVYSFGVLLLELLTGKYPEDQEYGISLPVWVESVLREEWTAEVFDRELEQNYEEEMLELLQLALQCVVKDPAGRPSMLQVVGQLEEIASQVNPTNSFHFILNKIN